MPLNQPPSITRPFVSKFYVLLGWLALAFGFLGAFLPVLPTTPFVLLAAYFFSKGSQRLHRWLVNSPLMGKVIKDWQQNGAIGLKAKWLATVMMVLLFGYTLTQVPVPLALKVLISAIGLGVMAFIWSRPSAPLKSPLPPKMSDQGIKITPQN